MIGDGKVVEQSKKKLQLCWVRDKTSKTLRKWEYFPEFVL